MMELDVVIPKECIAIARNHEYDKRASIIQRELNRKKGYHYKMKDSDVVDENGVGLSKTLITKTANNLGKRIFYSIAVIDKKIFMFGGTDGKRVYGELYSFDTNTLQWKIHRRMKHKMRYSEVHAIEHHKVCIYNRLLT